jgi:hypothetical protein
MTIDMGKKLLSGREPATPKTGCDDAKASDSPDGFEAVSYHPGA